MTLEEQVGKLTGRVYQLEKEVARLKALAGEGETAPQTETDPLHSLNGQTAVSQQPAPVEQAGTGYTANGEQVVVSDTPIMQNASNTSGTTPVSNGPMPVNGMNGGMVPPITYSQPQTQQYGFTGQTFPKRDSSQVEKTVGIKVMAVVASLLVFVSLILFGSLVFEYLPAVGKVGIMALVSVIFAAVGLINMKKDTKLKVLFSAIAGCGVGGLYITILVAAFLIESIHLVSLLIMLGVWTVFIMILSKFMSKMFAYICYVGIAVSSIYFGYFGEESMVALIYFLVSISLLFAINYSGSFFTDAFFFIQLPIAAFVLSQFYENTGWVHPALAGLVAVVMCVQIFVYRYEKKDVAVMIIYSTLSLISMAILTARTGNHFIEDFEYYYEILTAVLILISVLYGIRFIKNQKILYYPVFYMTALMIPAMEYSFFVEKYIGIAVFMLALIIAGHIANNRHFKYVGYAYFLIYALKMSNSFGVAAIVVLAVMAIALAYVFAMTKIKYSMDNKLALFAGAVAVVLEIASWEYINHTVVFILLAIFSIIVNKKWFSYSPVDGHLELPSAVVSYVANAIMMVWGSFALMYCNDVLRIVRDFEDSSLLMIMLVSLLTIAMFSMNTVELFKYNIPESLVGVYICLKFTWLVAAIMIRLDASGYIVSLAGLALAIAFIVAGFLTHKKSFRLYGLILTIICVIKLVIMDIEYSYDLLKPVSYLLAGVLCFGISWFYSRIEKKESREEEQSN